MLTKVNSATIYGLEVIGIEVEVNVSSRGFPTFDIVGMPNKAINESKERIRTALINSGIKFPNKKITVNLAPADIPKEGSYFDLPIAVGIVASIKEIEIPDLSVFFGEVSLDGTLRHLKGATLFSLYARERDIKRVYVPITCANEAASITDIKVFGITSLFELFEHLFGNQKIKASTSVLHPNSNEEVPYVSNESTKEFIFDSVIGQEKAKRALQIAVAGEHNVLFYGMPGVGKTMLAKSVIELLPPLTYEEALEVTKIHSIAGNVKPNQGLIFERPFRAPHHTISYVGLVGGGSIPKPGEVSLSHRGVLFMDEFPEYTRNSLEALREPIENGYVTISRSRGRAIFPSNFTLIAAMNPCPCGYYNHPKIMCSCAPHQIRRYLGKISGPLLDRFEIKVELSSQVKQLENMLLSEVSNPITKEFLSQNVNSKKPENTLENIQSKILAARSIQAKRYKLNSQTMSNATGLAGNISNAAMTSEHIRHYCVLDKDSRNLLRIANSKYNFSNRSYLNILKVARTIADLRSSKKVEVQDIAESLDFRGKIKKL